MACGDVSPECGDYVTACGDIHLSFAAGQGVALGWTVLAADGTPLDLTDYTFSGQISFPTPVTLSLGAGTIACPIPTSGAFTLTVGGPATQVPAGVYPFQLWVVAPDDTPLPPFSGAITLTPSLVYP